MKAMVTEQDMDFRLLRNGTVDGVPTQQDITTSPQRYEWSDERKWKPETPNYIVPMVLKCVRVDADGDRDTFYFVARYLHDKWRDVNTQHLMKVDGYTKVYWKLI